MAPGGYSYFDTLPTHTARGTPIIYVSWDLFARLFPAEPPPQPKKTKWKTLTLAERGRSVLKIKRPKVKQFYAKPRIRNLHRQ